MKKPDKFSKLLAEWAKNAREYNVCSKLPSLTKEQRSRFEARSIEIGFCIAELKEVISQS